MPRFRPLPILTLLSLAALALLVMLGNWQYQRFGEKRLAKAEAPAQTSLGPIAGGAGEPVLIYGVRNGVAGWRVLAPVSVGEGANTETVLVDSAFLEGVAPPPRGERRVPGALAAGVALPGAWTAAPDATVFSPPPDPAARLAYGLDAEALAAFGLTGVRSEIFATPYVGLDGRPEPNPFANPAAADPLPPERHLGYAWTWWGLAASLLAIYLVYHHRVGRLRFKAAA
jgi:surfeit locus 1 family protein